MTMRKKPRRNEEHSYGYWKIIKKPERNLLRSNKTHFRRFLSDLTEERRLIPSLLATVISPKSTASDVKGGLCETFRVAGILANHRFERDCAEVRLGMLKFNGILVPYVSGLSLCVRTPRSLKRKDYKSRNDLRFNVCAKYFHDALETDFSVTGFFFFNFWV